MRIVGEKGLFKDSSLPCEAGAGILLSVWPWQHWLGLSIIVATLPSLLLLIAPEEPLEVEAQP